MSQAGFDAPRSSLREYEACVKQYITESHDTTSNMIACHKSVMRGGVLFRRNHATGAYHLRQFQEREIQVQAERFFELGL